MKVKQTNTSVISMHPSIEHALNVVDRVWFAHTGTHAIVTGLQEEGHSAKSKHYGLVGDIRCRAIDIRDNLDADTRDLIDKELSLRLARGFEFDIVWESNHLHIEYDPKM